MLSVRPLCLAQAAGLLALTAGFSGWASAAPAIDQSNLAPTTNSARATTGGTIFGQVVRAGQSGYLTQVDLSLAKTAGLTGDLFFQVVGVDGAGQPDLLDVKAHRVTNLDGVPDDTPLQTPLPFPASFDLTQDLVWVEPGDEFVVAVSRFAPGAPPWVTLRTTSGGDGGYADGELFSRGFDSASPWVEVSSGQRDAGFQTWVDPAPALPEANTVEVRPTFDAVGALTPGATLWTVTDGTNGIGVQEFGTQADEERAILEFALPRLPEGAEITGARLNLDMGGGSGEPSIAIHPYVGNGTLDTTDALETSQPAFITGPVRPVGGLIVELTADVIDDAYASGTGFIGFLMQLDNTFRSVIFASLERNLFSISSGEDLPALEIDFTLAAVVGDYDNSGQIEQGDLDQVLQNWGQGFASIPGTWINNRPTEGVVDQAELDAVLQNWGGTAAPNFRGVDVPEPSALSVLGLTMLNRRRRA